MRLIFFSRFSLIVCFLLGSKALVFSQDTTTTKTTTNLLTNGEAVWYMQPWVWVVGGVALLLLLIALFSGGRKKDKSTSRTDKVIITKTVRTETDVED